MRKIYDRPKHDLDLTDFSAWRLYQEEDGFDKGEPHGAPVVSKLYLQPKWLLHAFGLGLPPRNHTKSAHREFVFEDNDLSRYLLYEYRNTTFYCPNDPNFDYEHQEHLANYRKKIKRLSPEEFWTSEDKF